MINGHTEGKYLDAPEYEPILTCAEALDVPVYLHPGIPPAAVRETYFAGLPDPTGFLLAGRPRLRLAR